LGNYSKAGEFYKRLLDETPGYHLIQKAACLSGLGNVAKAQGHYSNAKSYYQEALDLKRQMYRNDFHPDLAVNFNNMGLVCRHLKEIDDAVKFHKHALTIRKQVVEDNQQNRDVKECCRRHIDVADSLYNLANVYSEQNKVQLAFIHVKESLSISEQYLQSDDPKIAIDYRLIGILHQIQNEYNEAKNAYEKALTIQKKVLGEDKIETAATKCCLGSLLWNEAHRAMDKNEPYEEAMKTGYSYCCEGMACFDKFDLAPDHQYRKSAKLVIEQYEQNSNRLK
jgi:tetratricopeptide (TPR) repeat protein